LIIVLSENDIWMSGQMLHIHLTQKLHVLCTIIILNDKVRQALTAGNLTHLVPWTRMEVLKSWLSGLDLMVMKLSVLIWISTKNWRIFGAMLWSESQEWTPKDSAR